MGPYKMFLNDLFTIEQILPEGDDNKFLITIRLNPFHEIFKGHFPGNPILPGVCIVQILKEILMFQSDKKLMMINASSIKYLSFINPKANSVINIAIELKEPGNDIILCNSFLYFESVVFCRFKGEFKNVKTEEA
jgi:3-hydroxyacyl-[acyl-carrier-protein] dehydratase